VYNFMDKVDFITTMALLTDKGNCQELGMRGGGHGVVLTNLCVFDFDEATKIMRLKSLHPGVTIQNVLDNIGFEPVIASGVEETPPPAEKVIRIIRELDPLETRKRGFSSGALKKHYDL